MTNEEVRSIILETIPVGAVVFKMDDLNPSETDGGTWTLITGDASLSFGDGTQQSGLVSSDNTPVVPIVKHNHSIEHDHPSVNTNTTGNHNHTAKYQGGGTRYDGNSAQNDMIQSGTGSTGSTGNHYHSVNIPNY